MYPDARKRLMDAIAKKDAERGRPLTNLEKLTNLSRALYGDDRMVPKDDPTPAPPEEPAR